MFQFNKKFIPLIILIFILLFAIALRVINISFPFGDFDEGVYIATARSVVHGFPLIEKTYNSQFPLFADSLAFLYHLYPNIVFLRLFPIICSFVVITLAFLIAKKYIGIYAAVFIGLYFACNSIFLSVSRTIQADMPWVSFSMLAYFFLLLFDDTRKKRYFFFSILSFFIGIFIKANPVFLVVYGVYFLYLLYDYKKKAFIYFLAFVLTGVIVSLLVIPIKDIHLFYDQAIAIRAKGTMSVYGLDNGTRMLLLKHELPLILLNFFSMCLIGVKNKFDVKEIVENRFFILTLTWVFATSIIFIFYHPLFTHHLVFFIAPAALLAGYSVQAIMEKNKLFVIFFLLILFYVSFTQISDKDIIFPRESSYDNSLSHAASYVARHSDNNDYVISDELLIQYLANRNTPPNEVDTSFVRIQTNHLDAKTLIADTKKYNVKVIAAASGRLVSLPEYMSFLYGSFRSETLNGITIFTRK